MVFGVPGLFLAGWMVFAGVNRESAFDLMVWMVSWVADLENAYGFANWAIDLPNMLFNAAAAGSILGFVFLWMARIARRPANQSSDGKYEIELAGSEHRVGMPLEGVVRPLRAANPGDVYTLVLACQLTYRTGDDDSETYYAFKEARDVRLVQGARSSSLAFRFEVPSTAPQSGASGDGPYLGTGRYSWSLSVGPKGKWFMSTFGVTLESALGQAGTETAGVAGRS